MGVAVEAHPIVLTSLADYRLLVPAHLAGRLVDAGLAEGSLVVEAAADLAAHVAAGRFLAALVVYVVSGVVPAT